MCSNFSFILYIKYNLGFKCLGVTNGLNISVCKKTKHGIYKGQLVKVETALNGGNLIIFNK